MVSGVVTISGIVSAGRVAESLLSTDSKGAQAFLSCIGHDYPVYRRGSSVFVRIGNGPVICSVFNPTWVRSDSPARSSLLSLLLLSSASPTFL
jgi:hypothetical protein